MFNIQKRIKLVISFLNSVEVLLHCINSYLYLIDVEDFFNEFLLIQTLNLLIKRQVRFTVILVQYALQRTSYLQVIRLYLAIS